MGNEHKNSTGYVVFKNGAYDFAEGRNMEVSHLLDILDSSPTNGKSFDIFVPPFYLSGSGKQQRQQGLKLSEIKNMEEFLLTHLTVFYEFRKFCLFCFPLCQYIYTFHYFYCRNL